MNEFLKNKIIGMALASLEEDKVKLIALYVLPEYQRQGIGKMLMQKVLDFSKNSKQIRLEVAAYNQQAINFYQKNGFKLIPESEDQHEIIPNKFIPTVKMKKDQKNK
ncbi:MAG: GNAT family N-acetyltransferase [Candidatus Moranbacteria bacterium]|nr:GNAT family N-acetyltransferase [Candidatus Moranbacteria bacterium]